MTDPAVEHEAEAAQAVGPEDDQDHLALLRELVGALPDRFRRVLTLFYYEERSVTEVAQMLGLPEGTVKTNLFRARAALGERLRVLGLADPQFWLEKPE